MERRMNIDNLISVAAVVRNHADIIKDFIDDLTETLSRFYANYEIVLVDNGSTDSTVEKILGLQKEVRNVRLIVLSRQYSEEITYIAALENCIGDFVTLLDPCFDPPQQIPQMIAKSQSGYDVVIAESKGDVDKGIIDRVGSKLFFMMSKYLTGYDVPPSFSKFIVLSRRAVNSITRIKDRNRYLKFLLLEIGFKRVSIPSSSINRRHYKPKQNYFSAFAFAVEAIVSNSEKLIRLAALTGFFAGLLNLCYVLYVLVGYLLYHNQIAEGWTSTQVVGSTMWFLLFLILAIIGEYLARVLRATRGGDLYYIADESNSSVCPSDIERKNVI